MTTDLPFSDLLNVALTRYPVPLGDYAEAFRVPRRTVEQALTDLRRRGFPICSDGRGVWVGDLADLQKTASSLQRRIAEQYVTLRAVRRTARAMSGLHQETLGFEDVA